MGKGFFGKHSEETKEKIRSKLAGRTIPKEVRDKISNTLKGKMPKFIPNNKGRMPSPLAFANSIKVRAEKGVTQATRLKMSATHKRLWAEGKHVVTEEWRRKIVEANKGENNHGWKGGITSESSKIRSSAEYKLWRTAVFKRDNYTCVFCGYKSAGKRPPDINADHIKPMSVFPELRFAIDNGRTLCLPCHRQTDTYGGRIHKYKKSL